MPRWENAPQAHSRVSNINFDIWIWGDGNTFELMTEWQTTLPSFVNFSWDIYKVPLSNPNIKVDI
jgi:hypothetical protein